MNFYMSLSQKMVVYPRVRCGPTNFVEMTSNIQDITMISPVLPVVARAGNQATVWTGLYLGFELNPGLGSRLPMPTHTIRGISIFTNIFATQNQAKCRKIYVSLIPDGLWSVTALVMGTWSTKVMCWYCWRLEILADQLRVHWKSWGKNNEIFTRSLGGGLKHF